MVEILLVKQLAVQAQDDATQPLHLQQDSHGWNIADQAVGSSGPKKLPKNINSLKRLSV